MKINKKILLYIIIVILCFGIFGQYYLEHFVTDAYKEVQLGTGYLAELKLIEGRPVQSLYFILLNKIGINISSLNSYLIIYRINLTVSILLLAFLIIYTYNIILKTKNVKDNKKKILILLTTSILFINLSVNEYLLFIENYIMILGMLFTIIGGNFFIKKENKYRYIISFFLLLFASFCYQGTITLFLPFTFLLILLEKINTKELIKMGIMYLLVLVINYLTIRYFYCILPKYDGRIQENVNLLSNVLDIMHSIAIYFTLFGGIVFFFVIAINKEILMSTKKILNILTIIFISIASFACFRFGNTAVQTARLTLSMYCIMGIIYLYIIVLKEKKLKTEYITLYISIGIYLLATVINLIYFQKLHINSTKQNQDIVYKVINKINEYESNTGIKIENVAFYCDQKLNFKYYNANIGKFCVYTYPLLYCDWSDIYCINALSHRNFNKVDESRLNDNLNEYFSKRNWNEFNVNEQVIFTGNIVNICIF